MLSRTLSFKSSWLSTKRILRAKRRWSPASLIAQLVGGDVLDDLVDDDGLRGAVDLEDDGLGVGVGRVGARLAEAEGPELVAHRRGDGAHGGPGHPSAGGEGSEGEEVAVCQTLKDPNFAPFIQQNQSGRKQMRQEIHFFVNRYKSMSILRGVGREALTVSYLVGVLESRFLSVAYKRIRPLYLSDFIAILSRCKDKQTYLTTTKNWKDKHSEQTKLKGSLCLK